MTDESKNPENEETEGSATATAPAVPGAAGEEEFEFAEPPKFDLDYKGDCYYEVKTTIPAANRAKQAEELYDELKHEAELPGFRRGKAPVKLIEKKFGKAVDNEVEAKLVGAAFQKLVKDEDLKPLGMPDIDGLSEDDEERNNEEPIEVTFKFEVSPKVELGKYRGIEVERPVVKVDEQDVEETIREIQERHAVYESVEDAKAAEGDQAIIDFKGTIDGEEFSGGSAENYPYVLGSQRFFPEFEEVLQGSSPGDELKCNVTFPEDYFAEELRGKEAEFTIKVNEIKRRALPELNDEFAEQVGYESVADMKDKVREQLQENASERSNQITESRAVHKVVEDSSFEIPKTMIDRVAADYQEQEMRSLMQARIPYEQIEERIPEIQERARENAIDNIKSLVILNEIGEAEGIEVTGEDFEKEAENISKSVGADIETVVQYMAQEEQRNSIADRIFRRKATQVIMDNAKVTEKELTREEMEEESSETIEDEEK